MHIKAIQKSTSFWPPAPLKLSWGGCSAPFLCAVGCLPPTLSLFHSWPCERTATSSSTRRGIGSSSMVQQQQTPLLHFYERIPPYAAYAAAKLASCSLDVRAEIKGTKDTLHLAFPSTG